MIMHRLNEKQGDLNNGQVLAWRQEFQSRVSRMLLPNHSDGTALLRFLRHWMFSWRIHNVEAMDVLQEGVKRGLVYIQEKEKPIANPTAWLRGTCLNILRDKVKEAKQGESLISHLNALYSVSEDGLPLNSRRCPLANAEFSEQVEQLQKAIYDLSPDDKQLICLRFFEEKTYAQIQKYFQARDGQFIAEAALRQRESRALKRLRNIFFKVYDKGADAAL
jgi:RNA polymerase sigma factor (sigma-70 family)